MHAANKSCAIVNISEKTLLTIISNELRKKNADDD